MVYKLAESVRIEGDKTLILRDRMQDIAYGGDGGRADEWPIPDEQLADIVVDEITDTSRWSTHHRVVFKLGGKYYESHYSRGATEMQDESPYEYDGEWIKVTEVAPVPVTVTKYEPVLERGVVVYEEPCPEEGSYILSDSDFAEARGRGEVEYGEDIYVVIGDAVRTTSGWREVKTETEAVE